MQKDPHSHQHELEKGLLPPNKVKNPAKREVRSQLIKLGIMISMTFVVFLVELFYGYLSNSLALVADAFHMLSDVLALGVALACILIARRKSKSNTFGWVRAEVLGALVNGIFLLALCFSILLESIEHLLEPSELKEPLTVLIVGIIGLLVNVIGMFLFHSHSHGGHGHSHDKPQQKDVIDRSSYLASSHQAGSMSIAAYAIGEEDAIESLSADNTQTLEPMPKDKQKLKSGSQMNMKGVYLHIITDFIGSVIVIITSSISYFFPHLTLIKLYADPALSLIMVLLIMSSTIPLVRETALILLQTTPKDVDLQQLKQRLLQTPGVLAVHELHVWRLVGIRIIATIHIRFESLDHYLRSAQQIRNIFHDNKVHSVTIQPEFAGMIENVVNDQECVLKCEPEDCKDAACC